MWNFINEVFFVKQLLNIIFTADFTWEITQGWQKHSELLKFALM